MRTRLARSTFGLAVGVSAAIAAVSIIAPAAAQDKPVELKFAFWVPATHPLAKLGYEPWAKSVEAASKGSIKVALFPAQQLGKAPDHYDMARDGIAELTWVNPGYQAGRFPIFAAGELPFLMSDQGGGSAALDAWYRKYAAKEMGDVHFCYAHLHIGTLHSKVPITDPGQIKGMKIRPANGTVAQLVTALGGTSVQLSAPEVARCAREGPGRCHHLPLEVDPDLRHRQGRQVPCRSAALSGHLRVGDEQELVRQAVHRPEEGDRRPLH